MRFGILGPLEVRAADGRSVRVPELKVRALLAALLVGQGRPASADGLVEDLWGARPPAKPVSALRAKVSQLRRALDNGEQGSRELVVSGTSGYLLRLGPDAVDASRFEALVSRAHSLSDTRARSSVLAEALALWRGPALADFADEAFAQAAITRLEEQRLAALEAQAEARLELGEHHLMVGELNDLVTAHPLRERVRAAQMRSLYRSGQQTAALQSYTELYQRLDEELGLAPGTELAELQQAILQQDPSLDPPSASAATAARPRTNLAPAPTELVGRARETDEVLALLRTERLVTLIGPGGVGKTRLAREAAGSLLHSFPGGAWIVEPSGGQGPLKTGAQPSAADVASEVAEAMELPDPAHAAGGETGVIDRLAAALASGPTLLVLDGCEHVVTGAAKLTAAMLAAAPELRVLATSREPLDTDGEQLYEVPALDVPEAGGDPAREVIGGSGAVELFTKRVAASIPSFTLNEANTEVVALICRRLDGIPLALELAATRVRALGVHELAARLDDRFRLLAGGSHRAPARHQTMRATLDWSWDLLTEPERAVLRRLAVHVDGCTLAAAEAVCAGPGIGSGEVLDLLARLVSRSLVTMVEDESGPRYRLLESVGAYCTERLHEAGESGLAAERHSTYYTEFAERAAPYLCGPEQRRWLRLLDVESANLRAALEAAVERGDAHAALRLVDALFWYWHLRARLRECRRSLQAALDLEGYAPADLRGAATVRLAAVRCLVAPDAAEPSRTVVQTLAAVEGSLAPLDRARAQWFTATTLFSLNDTALGPELVEKALVEFRAQGDRWGTAAALSMRTWYALLRGDLTAASRDGEEGLALFRELGDQWGQIQAGDALANLAEIKGDYERAARLHAEGLHIAEGLGLWHDVPWKWSGMGRIALVTGDYARARELHEQGLRRAGEHLDRFGELYAELGLGLGARREGRLDAAEDHMLRAYERMDRPSEGSTGALIKAELGFVAELRGDTRSALDLQLEGAAIARDSGEPRAVALAWEGLAGAHARAGRAHYAAQLLGAAAATRESVGAPLPPAERGDVERISEAVRSAVGGAVLAQEHERGAQRDPDDLPP